MNPTYTETGAAGMGDWDLLGLCRDNPNAMAYSDTPGIWRARDLCRECPVWTPCRAWALGISDRDDEEIVIGGLSLRERNAIRKQRKPSPEPEPSTDTDDLKQCVRCLDVKPAGEFYAHRGAADGLTPACRKCLNQARRLTRSAA